MRLTETFPRFDADDPFFGFRNINLVAVINHYAGDIKWSLRGAWPHQHDLESMETGGFRVFNNNHDGTNSNTKHDKRLSIVIVNPNNGNLRSLLKVAPLDFFGGNRRSLLDA